MDAFTNKLRIKNDTRHLSHVREMLSSNISRTALSREQENKVILAIDEAITNIMEHAYEDRDDGWIDIELHGSGEKLEVVIRDTGKKFNPETLENPDVSEHVREGKKKGLGIFLMRQIMDEVRYRFKDGKKNEIRLVKYT